MRPASRFAAALCAALGATAAFATDFTATFDGQVATGLPVGLDLPPASGGGPSRRLVVEAPLRAVVDFPGEGAVRMFHAHLDGQPAVVTRAGGDIRITVTGGDGVDVLAPQPDGTVDTHHLAAAAEGSSGGRTRRAANLDGGDTPFVHLVKPDDLPLDDTGEVQPLRVYLFVHDELTKAPKPSELAWIYGRGPGRAPLLSKVIENIHAGYVAWWLADLERNVLPGEPLRVTYMAGLPGITDASYGTVSTLIDWAFAMRPAARRHGLPWGKSYRNKFVLLLPDDVAPGIAGKAFNEGNAAVASMTASYSVVAHELGHTLGAIHEDSDVRFAGAWWCQTNMYPASLPLVGNCYEYTLANRLRIQDYYSGGPARPRAQPVTAVDDSAE
jgi:hypothetical protein